MQCIHMCVCVLDAGWEGGSCIRINQTLEYQPLGVAMRLCQPCVAL